MPFPSSNINNLTAMAEEADAVGAVIDTNTHVMRSLFPPIAQRHYILCLRGPRPHPFQQRSMVNLCGEHFTNAAQHLSLAVPVMINNTGSMLSFIILLVRIWLLLYFLHHVTCCSMSFRAVKQRYII